MKKTISYLLMGVGMVSLLTLANCSKKNDSLPQIDGYSSSDAVAPDALVAYFPFDGNSNDTKGGSTASAVGVTYPTGLRGQAYQGATGAYATLTPSAAFSSLPSYSLSLWYKLSAQPDANSGPQGLFFLAGTNTLNELIYEIDRPSGSQVGTDSLKLHHGFTNLGSAGYQGFTMEAYDTTKYKNYWIHVVTTYDASSSTYVVYQDGIASINGSAFGKTASTVLYQGQSGAAATTGQGSLSWSTDPPKQIIIGTWPATLYGVSPTLGSTACFLGQMDELRIFNRALTTAEVGALFQLGLAGR
jgi:hypothetical protein